MSTLKGGNLNLKGGKVNKVIKASTLKGNKVNKVIKGVYS